MTSARALGFVLIGLVGLIGSVGGCGRASEEQRAEAAREGRNLAGTSPVSRDDRIPAFEADLVTSRAGYLDEAFAMGRVEPDAIAWLAALLTKNRPELGEVSGALAGASLSVSALTTMDGVHVRVHVWTSAGENEFEAAATDLLGMTKCSAFAEAIACNETAVLRAVEGGYVIDAVRSTSIAEALGRASGEGPVGFESLRGDMAWRIDGPATIQALRRSAPELDAALTELRETERLFTGITIELTITDDQLLGRGRWSSSDGAGERIREVFELDPVDADVPSLASLCEGALACGRSRGLPNRERFVGLATGIYSDPDRIAPLVSPPEGIVLLLETWPNAIGSGLRWPGEVTDPGEAMVLQTSAEIAQRALGFGFSIRADGTALGYARMGAADLDSIARFTALAGSGFSANELDGVDARVESMSGGGIAGAATRIYRVIDPDGAWGWLITADRDTQVAWFTGLAHDDGAVPITYVEIPNFTELLAEVPDSRRWLGFMDGSELGLRAQISLTAELAPELRFVVGDL